MSHKLIISTFAAAIAVAGCGGSNVPSIAQIKADFDSPSGSVKSKQSVAGAVQKQSSSNSAAGLALGGFGGGRGLSSSQKFESAQFHRLMGPMLDQLRAKAQGISINSLRSASDCNGSPFGDGINSTSGNFSYDVDLATCGGDTTGHVSVTGSYQIDQAAGTAHVQADETLTQVCSGGTCINGTMSLEVTIGGSSTADPSGAFVAGWSYTVTEGSKSFVTRGGLRLRSDGMGAGALEYVIYVQDESGKEVSLVLSFEADGQGNASLHIRGTDGEISCTLMADGSGMCTGDLNWDAAYYDAFATDAQLGAL